MRINSMIFMECLQLNVKNQFHELVTLFDLLQYVI